MLKIETGFGADKNFVTGAADPAVPRSACQLLEQAAQIQAERALEYDQPYGERSMGQVVAAFNAIKGEEVLKESDGWLLQVLLKVVRDQAREHVHLDSCKDMVSYGALYGEARIGGR